MKNSRKIVAYVMKKDPLLATFFVFKMREFMTTVAHVLTSISTFSITQNVFRKMKNN